VAAAAPGERGPDGAADDAVERRAVQHEHRALGGRRVERHDPCQLAVELVVARELEELVGEPGADERVLHPDRGARDGGDQQHGVAREQRGGDLQQRPGPRGPIAHVDADDTQRRPHERGAAPPAQRRDRPEPLVGERARPVVGQPVQSADGREQLGEHCLAARLAGVGGEQVGKRVELVEHRHRGTPQVPRPVARRDERPQRLRGGGAVDRGHVPGRYRGFRPVASRG